MTASIRAGLAGAVAFAASGVYEASQRAAERIPGARFVSLESGGHLMLGQTKNLGELAKFFGETPDQRAGRVAESVCA